MKKIVKTILFVAIVSTANIQAQTDDALKIDANGNVGINTTTPSEKLEVNGNLKVSGTVNTNNISVTSNVTATNVNATGKVQENGKDLLPKGTIVMWYPMNGSTNPPAGWAICDGKNDTPDLRGRFIVGVGQSNNGETDYKLKGTGGSEKVTLTENQMPIHKHNITGTNDVQVMYKDTYAIMVQGTDNDGRSVYDRDGNGTKIRLKDNIALENTGGSQPHENRPPYYALYYIIKL